MIKKMMQMAMVMIKLRSLLMISMAHDGSDTNDQCYILWNIMQHVHELQFI